MFLEKEVMPKFRDRALEPPIGVRSFIAYKVASVHRPDTFPIVCVELKPRSFSIDVRVTLLPT